MNNIKWDYLNWQVDLFTYKSGHIGIIIQETNDDEVAFLGDDLVVSLNIKNLKEDEIAIKNYNGFIGLLDELLLAEVIEIPHQYLKMIYEDKTVLIPIVRLKKSSTNLDGVADDLVKQNSQSVASSAKAGSNSLGE